MFRKGKISMFRKPQTAVLVVTMLSMLSLVLAACGGGASGTGSSSGTTRLSIVGVAGVAQDAFWITVQCGAQKEANTLGVNFTWKAGNTPDVQTESTNLQSALLQKPNGVLLAPFSQTTFVTTVQNLMNDGTPVALVSAPLAQPVYYQKFASDNSTAGYTTLAQAIVNSMGGSGSLAILAGIPGTALDKPRDEGLITALQQIAPNVKVLPIQYPQLDKNKAATIVSSLIIAHPDLKAVYATSGPEGEGAAAGVQQSNKQGQVHVFAYDATPDEVNALNNGTITALLAQSPIEMGQQAIQSLVSYLQGSKANQKPVTPASPQDVSTQTMVLTKDNVNTPAAAPFVYHSTCS
jgi:ribose transport system substrate-binding protein